MLKTRNFISDRKQTLFIYLFLSLFGLFFFVVRVEAASGISQGLALGAGKVSIAESRTIAYLGPINGKVNFSKGTVAGTQTTNNQPKGISAGALYGALLR